MNQPATDSSTLVRSLREAAPYLYSHRRKTFVISLAASFAAGKKLDALIADLLVLRHICDIRFAIAFDVQAAAGPISKEQIESLREASSYARDRIEQLLSIGAPGGIPGATAGGSNLVSAHRAGIVDGTDMLERASTPKIDSQQAKKLLDAGAIALLPPIAFAHNGSLLLARASDIALAFAACVQADKVIAIIDDAAAQQLAFRELIAEQAQQRIESAKDPADVAALLKLGIEAAAAGISRIHYINELTDGGILLELLSADGIAAMISRDQFVQVRQATVADVPGVAELLAPGIAAGSIAQRSIEQLRSDIDCFAVLAHDDALLACASLEFHGKDAEIRSLAVRPDSMNKSRGELLLNYCENKAMESGAERMLAISTQARDWFIARGFSVADPDVLPASRIGATEHPRNAVVLVKNLD